ncbi:multidrug DMT transporter permease [Streptomyces guryensis]|uniref:Multidrug DMT transporter permease n=1 Tax=Streptomyces guryensis TaxID=2886947 RepID=A0A9Q3VPD7_9ACTN|nr:multidrug DMT transporter permease [Streptomyces guryensis]MCD9874595.1 multidrug DMT transporter permease [Streptomyces guryensis]
MAGGRWPVAAGRVAVCPPLPTVMRRRQRTVLPIRLTAQALLVGAGAALGPVLHLLAAQWQPLAVAAVLASLHAALPVVLGPALLHDRVTRRQAAVGPGAAAATVLLTVG